MLKKRVLDIAVEEVNEKTDITVSYKLERYGRKVTNIHFTMLPKTEALPIEEKQDTIRQKLISLGVKPKKIEYLLNHHDEQYLQANITIVEEQAKKGNIKDITAYLLKAFSDDFRPIETEHDRLTKQKTIEKEAENKEKEKKKAALKELKQEYYTEKKEKITQVLQDLSDNELQNQKQAFIDSMMVNDTMRNLYTSKGFDNQIIQGRWRDFLAVGFLASLYHDFANYRRSKMETGVSAK